MLISVIDDSFNTADRYGLRQDKRFFVFDLNFKYSIGTVLDKKYLENILKNSQNKELFKPYVDEAVKYLKGKMKDVR